MYPPLLFWDQVPCAPWAWPVSPSTARLLRASCPTLVLISGGHLCTKTRGRRRGWVSPPDAPPSTPLLPSVAAHPGLKAVARSPHLRALLPPISSFSVNPPAFCLLRTPHNFWLTEGSPFLLLFWLSLLPFLGELEAPACAVITWPGLPRLTEGERLQKLSPHGCLLAQDMSSKWEGDIPQTLGCAGP